MKLSPRSSASPVLSRTSSKSCTTGYNTAESPLPWSLASARIVAAEEIIEPYKSKSWTLRTGLSDSQDVRLSF